MAFGARKQSYDYFEAFIKQADLAAKESQALVDALEDYNSQDPEWMKQTASRLHGIENEADVLCHEILDHLAVEFMPPIDREDVTELAMMLDDVIDLIEEVFQHLYTYNIHELHPYAVKVARIIDEAVDALAEATRVFREFKKPKTLNELLVAVHDRESEGDTLYIEAKRDLFVNHAQDSAAYLISWNGVFSHMEQCCDACERVASIMQKITLKNS